MDSHSRASEYYDGLDSERQDALHRSYGGYDEVLEALEEDFEAEDSETPGTA